MESPLQGRMRQGRMRQPYDPAIYNAAWATQPRPPVSSLTHPSIPPPSPSSSPSPSPVPDLDLAHSPPPSPARCP